MALVYLRDLLSYHKSERSLRSTTDITCLTIKRFRLTTYGDRSFESIAPRLWNKLPNNIKSIDCINKFKKELKTHLFDQCYM